MIGVNEQVVDIHLAALDQIRFAVKPAIAQIIHYEAEGRHVGPLGAVELYRNKIGARVYEGGDIHREGRVAAVMPARLNAVDEHLGGMGGAVKTQKIPPAGSIFDIYIPSVTVNARVLLGCGIVERQLLNGMGQAHQSISLRSSLDFASEKTFRRILREFPAAANAHHSIAVTSFHIDRYYVNLLYT